MNTEIEIYRKPQPSAALANTTLPWSGQK